MQSRCPDEESVSVGGEYSMAMDFPWISEDCTGCNTASGDYGLGWHGNVSGRLRHCAPLGVQCCRDTYGGWASHAVWVGPVDGPCSVDLP